MRILGLKAHMGLHRISFPEESRLDQIGCSEHLSLAEKAADASITLVKDTQNILRINPVKYKCAKVYFVENPPARLEEGTDPAKKMVVEELERVGFTVSLHKNFYDLEVADSKAANKFTIRKKGKVEQFKEEYDIVFVFVNINGYAQENNMRIKWSAGHSGETPWYVHEVPLVCISPAIIITVWKKMLS